MGDGRLLFHRHLLRLLSGDEATPGDEENLHVEQVSKTTLVAVQTAVCRPLPPRRHTLTRPAHHPFLPHPHHHHLCLPHRLPLPHPPSPLLNGLMRCPLCSPLRRRLQLRALLPPDGEGFRRQRRVQLAPDHAGAVSDYAAMTGEVVPRKVGRAQKRRGVRCRQLLLIMRHRQLRLQPLLCPPAAVLTQGGDGRVETQATVMVAGEVEHTAGLLGFPLPCLPHDGQRPAVVMGSVQRVPPRVEGGAEGGEAAAAVDERMRPPVSESSTDQLECSPLADCGGCTLEGGGVLGAVVPPEDGGGQGAALSRVEESNGFGRVHLVQPGQQHPPHAVDLKRQQEPLDSPLLMRPGPPCSPRPPHQSLTEIPFGHHDLPAVGRPSGGGRRPAKDGGAECGGAVVMGSGGGEQPLLAGFETAVVPVVKDGGKGLRVPRPTQRHRPLLVPAPPLMQLIPPHPPHSPCRHRLPRPYHLRHQPPPPLQLPAVPSPGLEHPALQCGVVVGLSAVCLALSAVGWVRRDLPLPPADGPGESPAGDGRLPRPLGSLPCRPLQPPVHRSALRPLHSLRLQPLRLLHLPSMRRRRLRPLPPQADRSRQGGGGVGGSTQMQRVRLRVPHSEGSVEGAALTAIDHLMRGRVQPSPTLGDRLPALEGAAGEAGGVVVGSEGGGGR